MKINSSFLILIIVSISVLSSCKKEEVYNVPSTIQPYIDEFLAEAAARGIDLTIDDLIVLFENDLEVDGVEAAGLCQSGGRKSTPTIKIDTTSLNWTLNLSAREQLIFHELGHCVLGRPHVNDRLPNGNYKTTMRASGEQIYGPKYSIFKREYYFDELFIEETSVPEWAVNVSDYNDISESEKLTVYEDLFNTSVGSWGTGSSAASNRIIENGVYKLQILQEGSYYVGKEINFDSTKDLEIEINATIPTDVFTGLLWAGAETAEITPNFNSIFVGQDVISIGSIENGSESSYQYPEFINSGFNKITIRKLGSNFIYYINEQRVDNHKNVALNGNEFGIPFGGPAGSEIQIADIRISYIQ